MNILPFLKNTNDNDEMFFPRAKTTTRCPTPSDTASEYGSSGNVVYLSHDARWKHPYALVCALFIASHGVLELGRVSIAVSSSMSSPLIPKKPEIANVLVMEDSLKMVYQFSAECYHVQVMLS